jgi:hypothetical protein
MPVFFPDSTLLRLDHKPVIFTNVVVELSNKKTALKAALLTGKPCYHPERTGLLAL